MLRFAEELMLLLFREESAELPAAPEAKLGYALAGALLMDLALLGRIDTDVRHLALVDETPLDDDLLDPALTAIAANTEQRSAEFWVRRLAEDAERIQARALARLREAGILEADPDASPDGLRLTFRVFRARRYPVPDGKTPGEAEQEVRLRIMRVLFSDDIPHPRDIVLICLGAACGLLDRLLTREEREDCAERINVVRRLDLIGQAVASAVRAASEAVPAATALPPRRMEKAIPEVAGLPVLGSAAAAAKDLIGLFHRSYQRYGPVFKLRLLNQRITVIAGSEANRQVHRKGRLFLRSQEVWTDFLQEVGASKVVTSLDGAEHRRLRKALARGYSRKSFESRMDVAIDICRRHIDAWPNNRPVAGKVAIQRLVVDQIGTILANVPPGKHLDDLVVFLDTLLLTRLAKMRPMILYRRKFERARKQVEALYARILREHSPGGVHADRGDLVNDVLALHRADPEFLPESDLLMACMGPYLAGVDTIALTCSFMLYELLKNPALADRVRAEAGELFAGGRTPTAADLGRLDVTHRVALEVLRLYPVTPLVYRISSNSFEVAGFRIPAGEAVVVATCVTHLLPQHFPEPRKFDIDRYLPERAEHRQSDAYLPFGIGAHRCLGAGFAEAQIMLTLAALMHYGDFALDPPGYQMQTAALPTLRPKRSFRIRKLGARQ